MAKSKSAKKKNHVSKHILKKRQDDSASAEGENDKTSTPSKKKSKANSHVKHPDEASSYLKQWKASKSGGPSTWKFNKNTQSWLIRHMYEADKVPKSTFLLLLEYLEGLEGETIKDRMRADASRRCRRHKDYCKNNPAETDGDEKDATTGEIEKGDNSNDVEEDKAPPASAADKAELEYEENLWKKLDDHEKRKQYKRARKILDLMKTT